MLPREMSRQGFAAVDVHRLVFQGRHLLLTPFTGPAGLRWWPHL
jgi:hypothetical protein